MDESKEQKYNSKKEYLINSLANAISNGKGTFLCPTCAHREVCSKMEEPSDKCDYFMDTTGPKNYSSIYHLFEPIFEWINTHYPAGEVKFIVDHNSARMVMDHGPLVLNKELQCCVDAVQNNNAEKKDEDI